MDKFEQKVRALIHEMKDDRNDGWSKEAYREELKRIQKLIEKALDES